MSAERALRALLVFDVDGTLCDSSSADGLLPVEWQSQQDFTAWYEAVRNTDFPPMRGAKAMVAALLANQPGADVYVMSARSVCVLDATEAWIARHFPELHGAKFWFRWEDDVLSSVESKMARLIVLADPTTYLQVTVVDDDEKMMAPCLTAGYTFVPAWQITRRVEQARG